MQNRDLVRTIGKGIFRILRRLCSLAGWTVLLSILTIVLMNVAMGPCSRLTEKGPRGRKTTGAGAHDAPSQETLEKTYPGKTLAETQAILADIHNSCPPGPQVANPPSYTSTYVNISEKGHRKIKDQRSYVRNATRVNVFVFGGSTTWGFGLPDDETIASHLQRRLNERDSRLTTCVFNYGVCASYSKYERRLFEKLILEGTIPDHVVFIDGLNEFCRIPLNRPREDEPEDVIIPEFLFRRVIHPVMFWREKLTGTGSVRVKDAVVEYHHEDLVRACNVMVANWRIIRGICREYDIGCALVLQPIAVYDYPLEKNMFLDEKALETGKSYYRAPREGYRLLLETGLLGPIESFLDLHSLRIDGHEYLDACHYTSAFSDRIAQALADAILKAQASLPIFDPTLKSNSRLER